MISSFQLVRHVKFYSILDFVVILFEPAKHPKLPLIRWMEIIIFDRFSLPGCWTHHSSVGQLGQTCTKIKKNLFITEKHKQSDNEWLHSSLLIGFSHRPSIKHLCSPGLNHEQNSDRLKPPVNVQTWRENEHVSQSAPLCPGWD